MNIYVKILNMKIICPICKTVTTWHENPWRPFCSERCKLIDLGKWASEEYRIPVLEQNKEIKKTEGQEELNTGPSE